MESQRLSLVEDLEHRPGTRDDALIKNAFIEKQEDAYVVKRPGLSILSAGAGKGNGIYFYNNILYIWDITIPNNAPLTLNI